MRKKVIGHKSYYIYDDGRIYSINKKSLVTVYTSKRGYMRVRLDGKMYLLHRLLCINFKPIEDNGKYVVNHIDENPFNNSLNNLEWVSQRDNIIKYYYSTSVSEEEKIKRFNLMMRPSGSTKEYSPSKQQFSISGIMSLKLCGINTQTIADNFGLSTRRIQQIIKRCENGY